MRNERRPRRSKTTARPGGVVVVSDFGGSLESALKEFKRTSAAEAAEDRRHRTFSPKPTRNARRLRGRAMEKRREAEPPREKRE